MTKERAKEMWNEWHWTTRAIVVSTLIGGVWGGVTAARNEVDDRYVTRREWNHQQDSIAASAVLRDVRDSSRQEQIARQLKYLICREDFSRQQCLRADR
jgi:hypothetical protein